MINTRDPSCRTTTLPLSLRATLPIAAAAAALGSLALEHSAHAQWVTFVNETASRMPTGAGQNLPAVTTADPKEKDYAWGDIDNDGDVDLVSVRKVPFTNPGGERNVLFLNENGVLIDRTSTKANTAINVPAAEGVSQGMLDATNDRDVVMADLNNDGWLDVITATTISDGLPRYIGHPRVYINLGESGGVWQGIRYDYNRIPLMGNKSGQFSPNPAQPWQPRFCSLAAGDVNGDGYDDLYFGDYDGGSFTPNENPAHDFDNKLLINQGAGNPGFFVDESVARMGTLFNYDIGQQNYLYAKFGAAAVIADMNGDGVKDVVKHTSLQNPIHVAVMTNRNPPPAVAPPPPNFHFNKYKIVYSLAAYFVTAGDLNNDGRLDLVMTDDGADRYLLNTGNDAQDQPNFTMFAFSFQGGGDDGFGGQNAIVDLNNDGFKDVLISDVDVDDPICCRRLHIYRNLGNVPNVTLREDSPSVIPTSMLTSTHNVAPMDVNGDGWIDLVIGRLSSTEVWMNAGMEMTVVGTPPSLVDPATGAAFQVQIVPRGGGVIVPGSAKLFVSTNGSAFVESPLAPLGGNLYQANLPGGPCGDNLRFYASVQFTSTGGSQVNTITLPTTAPVGAFVATRAEGLANVLAEQFEGSVGGWTITSQTLAAGNWEAIDPNGTTFNGQQAAPADDATPPPGVRAFVTLNGPVGGAAGNSDIDGTAGNPGTAHLTSPLIDATGDDDVSISYSHWFFSDNNSADSFVVAVSNNDGASWTTVTNQTSSSGGWQRGSFVVSDFVTPTAQVRVRFSATDGLPGSVVEGGLDDFSVDHIQCGAPCTADVNASGAVDVDDLVAVILGWGPCGKPPASCPADVNDSGAVDVDDLVAVILGWGSCP